MWFQTASRPSIAFLADADPRNMGQRRPVAREGVRGSSPPNFAGVRRLWPWTIWLGKVLARVRNLDPSSDRPSGATPEGRHARIAQLLDFYGTPGGIRTPDPQVRSLIPVRPPLSRVVQNQQLRPSHSPPLSSIVRPRWRQIGVNGECPQLRDGESRLVRAISRPHDPLVAED